jgi:hypothetical protein
MTGATPPAMRTGPASGGAGEEGCESADRPQRTGRVFPETGDDHARAARGQSPGLFGATTMGRSRRLSGGSRAGRRVHTPSG